MICRKPLNMLEVPKAILPIRSRKTETSRWMTYAETKAFIKGAKCC